MITNPVPIQSVPTRRSTRVDAAAGTGNSATGDQRHQALIPSGPRRDHAQPRLTVTQSGARPGVRMAADGVYLQLQTGPAPRGLRADASERRRYRDAYNHASVGGPSRPQPVMEKRA